MKKKKTAEVKVEIRFHQHLHHGRSDCHKTSRLKETFSQTIPTEDMDRETTGEPEMEHIPSSRRRSAGFNSRRTVDITEKDFVKRTVRRQSHGRQSHGRVDPADEGSPLTEVWRRTGTTGFRSWTWQKEAL